MRKLLCFALSALLLLGVLCVTAFADDIVAYVDYVNGLDSNDGLTAATAKKSIDNKNTGAMQHTKETGGIIVASGKLYFGGDYTLKTRRGGSITITGVYDGFDYQNPIPATNPTAGVMKMSKGAVLTIASDVTIDNFILFHEYDSAPNTIVVKDGAILTITDTVNCMSKGSQYYNIVVEKDATAIINGGTFSSITGEGTIQKSDDVVISAGYVDPDEGKPGVVYLNYTQGLDANDGKTPGTAKKLFGTVNGAGCISEVKYGGTIVVSGKAYMGGDYTLKDHEGPVTITSVYDGVDYKNPSPATNPACAFKMANNKTFTVTNDLTFDNVIIFSEYGTETIKVTSGATLTITDTVEFMKKTGSGYTLIVDSGATAVLSAKAQEEITVQNNGGTVKAYESSAPVEPPVVAQKTEVKLTVGSNTAYINGEAVAIDVAPINRNNRVMLPVRFLADTFGAEVAWDGETSTATLKNSEVTIVIVIGAPSMTVNNEEIALDSPAIIESSRTYLPLRAIANALGVANSNIAWDGETSTATLTK